MRKPLLFISLGTTIVLALTFASYFVLTKFHPEDEVRRMMMAMSRLKTVNESAGVHWQIVVNGTNVHTTLYTSGQVNLEDPSNFEYDTTFRSVRLDSSNQYTDLSGEVKLIDGKTFLTYAPPGPNVKGVSFAKKGMWVAFADGEFSSWGSIIPGMQPLSHTLSFDGREVTNWSPDSLTRLRALIAQADVFLVSFDGKTEAIRNQPTRVIDARFDPDATKTFLFDVVRVRDAHDPSDDDRLLVDAQATALSHLAVRMWIGVKDHLLYRVEVNGAIAGSDSQNRPPPAPSSKKEGGLIPVDARVEFSDFNKPFLANAPPSPLAFDSLFQSVFGSLPTNKKLPNTLTSQLYNSTTLPVFNSSATLLQQHIDSAADTDHDGLDNTLETFYGTNPNKSDTDGDGVNDGDEVRRGTNPRGKGSLFGFGLGK